MAQVSDAGLPGMVCVCVMSHHKMSPTRCQETQSKQWSSVLYTTPGRMSLLCGLCMNAAWKSEAFESLPSPVRA